MVILVLLTSSLACGMIEFGHPFDMHVEDKATELIEEANQVNPFKFKDENGEWQEIA